MQPALEGRKAGGRWRFCLLFSNNRYLVFYVTSLYRSLKLGQAAWLHLPICSPHQLAPCWRGCCARHSGATWTAGSPHSIAGTLSPAQELGGIAGKPHKTDLNTTWSFTERGVPGAGMAVLGSLVKRKQIPQSPSSSTGTGKKPNWPHQRRGEHKLGRLR